MTLTLGHLGGFVIYSAGSRNKSALHDGSGKRIHLTGESLDVLSVEYFLVLL